MAKRLNFFFQPDSVITTDKFFRRFQHLNLLLRDQGP